MRNTKETCILQICMEGNIRETNINLLAIENVSGKNRMVLDTDRLKKLIFKIWTMEVIFG